MKNIGMQSGWFFNPFFTFYYNYRFYYYAVFGLYALGSVDINPFKTKYNTNIIQNKHQKSMIYIYIMIKIKPKLNHSHHYHYHMTSLSASHILSKSGSDWVVAVGSISGK